VATAPLRRGVRLLLLRHAAVSWRGGRIGGIGPCAARYCGGRTVRSWVNATSAVTGALAVGVAAYLAAVFLTHDAERQHDRELAEAFRGRALVTGCVVGVLAAVGILVLRNDSPLLYHNLTSGQALPLTIVSVVAGLVSLLLLVRRLYVAVRITAALAVVGLLWGWGVGQYPTLPPAVTVADAAADESVLAATLVSLAFGALLLVPSLWLLYHTFQREPARLPPGPPGRPQA
jgi:cytochrome d ubiquinol oxidase subunit II